MSQSRIVHPHGAILVLESQLSLRRKGRWKRRAVNAAQIICAMPVAATAIVQGGVGERYQDDRGPVHVAPGFG